MLPSPPGLQIFPSYCAPSALGTNPTHCCTEGPNTLRQNPAARFNAFTIDFTNTKIRAFIEAHGTVLNTLKSAHLRFRALCSARKLGILQRKTVNQKAGQSQQTGSHRRLLMILPFIVSPNVDASTINMTLGEPLSTD